jgi:hypothetical protein
LREERGLTERTERRRFNTESTEFTEKKKTYNRVCDENAKGMEKTFRMFSLNSAFSVSSVLKDFGRESTLALQ